MNALILRILLGRKFSCRLRLLERVQGEIPLLVFCVEQPQSFERPGQIAPGLHPIRVMGE